MFLFEYITTLASGLLLLSLVTLIGYGLLDHWLGTPAAGLFSSYMYNFYLYILVGVGVFAILHLWMYFRSQRALQNNAASPSRHTARAFLAVFLVILVVAVACNFVALGYIAKNAVLGTADYSTKGLWLAILAPLQAGLWAGLLWWYFKNDRSVRSMKFYAVIAAVISLVATILLFAFPILAKRDAVIDVRTTTDLYSITAGINSFMQLNNRLPDELSQIQVDDNIKQRLAHYEYQKTGGSMMPTEGSGISLDAIFTKPVNSGFSYKLCAEFKTDTTKNQDSPITPLLSGSSAGGSFNLHKPGKQCFEQAAYGSSDNIEKTAPTDLRALN